MFLAFLLTSQIKPILKCKILSNNKPSLQKYSSPENTPYKKAFWTNISPGLIIRILRRLLGASYFLMVWIDSCPGHLSPQIVLAPLKCICLCDQIKKSTHQNKIGLPPQPVPSFKYYRVFVPAPEVPFMKVDDLLQGLVSPALRSPPVCWPHNWNVAIAEHPPRFPHSLIN